MSHKKALIIAAFAADAFSLGTHWIYDPEQIRNTHGRVNELTRPGPDSYHSTKNKGDFTHYGDQMLILLESLAACKGFSLQDFSDRWRQLFADYNGYVDGATRKTLAYYEKGRSAEEAGSHTGDFAGASRMVPVVGFYAGDKTRMIDAVRSQSAMTHNDPNTLDSASFFAEVADAVLNGEKPADAMKIIAKSETYEMLPVSMWVDEGLKSINEDTTKAVHRFGPACETKQVFPGVVHLIAKYEDDLKEALVQAVMAGGESAARGIMTAMILAAYQGMDAVPKEWVDGMNKKDKIFQLADKII